MKPPAALTGVAARVGPHIDRLLRFEQSRWGSVDPALEEPLAALREYVLAGGKRLRPALCHWAYTGAGGDPASRVLIDAEAALEMLHSAALVHDDIIDGSERRHGVDTLHSRFAALHDERGWSGRAGAFGEASAIIIGDLALIYSSRLMAGCPAPALVVFEEMRLEVNIGQYLDVLGAARGVAEADGSALDRARHICRYKTAKYTVERPLHLGAALAAPDRSAEMAAALSDFGVPLGEAFQLRDDLLGVFGDPEVTGKPVGDDLREGKLTVLAALTATVAPPDASRRFAERFGAPDLSVADVAEMQQLIDDSGARRLVEEEIDALAARARAAVGHLPLNSTAREALDDIAAFVVDRDR